MTQQMGHRYDTVIRGGIVVDGTGRPGYRADVAVLDGIIVRIGDIPRSDAGDAVEVDADGRLVTPGFVDIHTHYDGQAVWSDRITPSSLHGVTTAVMGNCGVGFAPCRPENRNGLIALMEGVEDIPAPVMHQGLSWDWESFPEFLDVLDQRPRDIDLCALLPHAPVRVQVMGKRALDLQPATAADVAEMRHLVAEAITAGAFGVSTSRRTSHRSRDGQFISTLRAREDELEGLMAGMSDAGRGVFEVVTDTDDDDMIEEFEMIRGVLARSGRPGLYSLLQSDRKPELYRDLLARTRDAVREGTNLRAVVAPRAIGLLLGLQASQNPFSGTSAFHEIAGLPLAARVARLGDPEFRARVLSEDPLEFNTWSLMPSLTYDKMFRCGDPIDYAPSPADAIQSIADREARSPAEVAYDVLLEDNGAGLLYVPFANYASGDLSAPEEMLADPNTVMGLGDGGAHVGFILDAGFPTFLLTYWVKTRGRFGIAEGIRRLTSDTADAIGLRDRGRVEVGLRADLNIIDWDRLDFGRPYSIADLPLGASRLMQDAAGYDATMVAGVVTYEHGKDTGARPGRLVRSGGVSS